MKKISKILSIMLIAVLAIVSINMVAIQADETKSTKITINESESGHTYNAYRIFSGDSNDEGDPGSHTLSNIKYDEKIYSTSSSASVDKRLELITALVSGPGKVTDGKDWSYPGYSTSVPKALSNLKGKETTATASEVAQAVKAAVTLGDNSRATTAIAQAFAYFFESQKIEAAGICSYVTDHYEITNLKEGYYVIVDEKASGTKDKSAVMLVVTDKDTATGTEIDPKVGDLTTATKSLTGTQVAYSVDGKDEIEFKVYVNTPDNAVDYAEYGFELIDTMTNLQYVDGSFHAYSGATAGVGDDIANHFTLTDKTDRSKSENDGTLTIKHLTFDETIPGVGKVTSDHWDKCKDITIVYRAKLTDGAKAADAHNSVYANYADDPDVEFPTSTTTTDPSSVYVFTHNLQITKTDGTSALPGANFSVQKWNGGTKNNDSDWDTPITQEAVGGTSNIFTWKGLGDGIYRIKETVTPSGYDTWLDGQYAYLKVTTNDDGADGTITPATNVQATLYQAFTPNASGGSLSSAMDGITFTYDNSGGDANGTIKGTIANVKGTELPETGGMGTKIFYTLGGLLATAAIVLLVVRRRMRTE